MAVAVFGSRPPKRSDLVLAAIEKALNAHATLINTGTTVRAVTVSVKMVNGTGRPRVAVLNVETETDCGET